MQNNEPKFLILINFLKFLFISSQVHSQYGNAILSIDTPSPIAGDYSSQLSITRGTFVDFTGISGTLELVNDGTATPNRGCNPLIGFTPGNIAVFDRGDCPFETKINNAKDPGAIAVVVINSTPGGTLVNSNTLNSILPYIFVSYETGEILKTEIANNPNATIR